MNKEFYLARIANAQSIAELETIIDDAAAWLENNADYETVYSAAIRKAQSGDWQ